LSENESIKERILRLRKATSEKPPELEMEVSGTMSPLKQFNAATAADREILTSIVDEFLEVEDWSTWLKLIESHGIHYLIILEFEGDEPFQNRFGANQLIILSPCAWEELVHFNEEEVPATIVAKAQLGSLEVVEVGRGPAGTSICIPGAGSDWGVNQIRNGIPLPLNLVSAYEVQKAVKLLDQGFLSERMVVQVINVSKALWVSARERIDANRLGINIANIKYETMITGTEGKEVKVPKWFGILAAIAIIAVGTIAAYYFLVAH
jgi:hypothetical protein